MGGRFFVVLILAVLLASICVSAQAQAVYPSVTLSYDAKSWTYTYHVAYPQNATDPFGELNLYTYAWSWNGVVDLWTPSGPVVGGVDQAWMCELSDGDFGTTVKWRAFGAQEVTAGPWEADFVLVAPNTAPVAGEGMTKDGVVGSTHTFSIDVPGPAPVPEPSALAALGSMLGAAGLLIRRRQR